MLARRLPVQETSSCDAEPPRFVVAGARSGPEVCMEAPPHRRPRHSIRCVRAGCALARVAKVGRTAESPGPAAESSRVPAGAPRELVTREALRQRLWPGDTFVDFEQGVNAAVKRLRETLADSAESPRFVETLPRRGYRFIAPVERDDRDRPGLSPRHRINAPAWHGKQAPLCRRRKAAWPLLDDGVSALIAAGAIALVLMTIAAWLRRCVS